MKSQPQSSLNHKPSRSPPTALQEMQCFSRVFQERARVRTRARGPGRAPPESAAAEAQRAPLRRAGRWLLPAVQRQGGAPPLQSERRPKKYLQRYLGKCEGEENVFLLCYLLCHDQAAREAIISSDGLWGARAHCQDRFWGGLPTCLLTCLFSPPLGLSGDSLRAGTYLRPLGRLEI